MAKRSKYQEGIIRRYYQNREAIALQKLAELVSELYLAEGKKRANCWKRIAGHLEKLGLAPERIEHLMAQNDPALVARVVEQFTSEK